MKKIALVVWLVVCLSLMLKTKTVVSADIDSEIPAMREGVMAIQEDDLVLLLGNILKDDRYKALEQVVRERQLRLVPKRAKGFVFPEGYQAVFVPVFDKKKIGNGFLVNSNDTWILSITVGNGKDQVIEGFIAEIKDNGQVVVQVGFTEMPDFDTHALAPMTLPENQALSMGSCLYIGKVGLNFGCWSPDSNPFGYYYVWFYRFGTPIDPWNHSWRACWWGSIHICPVHEYSGSPWRFPICGFAPRHPEG